MEAFLYILVFPGFLFLGAFGLYCEYLDRKLYAKFQNRLGPPWFQPWADFVKLLGKEEIIPQEANARMFTVMPLFALSSVVTAFLYIPVWGHQALYSFNGDAIVVLYLLTIPTLSFFIGGWYSTSLFARLGSVRTITQLFAYEVPLFISILAPALLANSWSLSEIAAFYGQHPWYRLFNAVGFLTALIALMGKLEKTPFDTPEAETEIVAGIFTEYSGRLLAFLKLTLNIEMVVGASLLAAVFLPMGPANNRILIFVFYVLKVLSIVSAIALARTVFARLRIDQMIRFSWKYMVPLSLLQLIINLIMKGILYR